MKITYDPKYDILDIRLKSAAVVDTDEEPQGFILDYDADGKIVGIEIHDASKHVDDPRAYAEVVTGPGKTVETVVPRATA